MAIPLALPPWLQTAPFGSPSDVLSQASAAAARRSQIGLAQQAAQQEAQQAAQNIALRRELAQQEAAQQMALAQLQAQGLEANLGLRERQLGILEEEEGRKARESALMFQGLQDFQRDVQAGLPYRDALIKNLGKLSIGDPSLLGKVRPDVNFGPAEDIGVPGYKGVMIGAGQRQVIPDPSYVDPTEQANINYKNAQLEALKNKINQVDLINIKSQADAITSDIVSTPQQKKVMLDELFSQVNQFRSQPSNVYKVGAIYKGGLKFLGGDPNLESSWQKVE